MISLLLLFFYLFMLLSLCPSIYVCVCETLPSLLNALSTFVILCSLISLATIAVRFSNRGYVGSDVINVHDLHTAILSGNSEEILWLLVVRTALKKGSDVRWIAVVGWKDPIPNEYTWLCNDHFVSGCIIK